MGLDQCRDTGMAAVLIGLLLTAFGSSHVWLPLSILLLVVNMVAPAVFRPAAWVWFGISGILGTVVSRVMLTVIFLVLVTPMGLVRKILGADPLRLNQWKTGSGSVFTVRDHRFTAEEIEKPY